MLSPCRRSYLLILSMLAACLWAGCSSTPPPRVGPGLAGGIGALLADTEAGVVIVRIAEGLPADTVGLSVGDRLLQIDSIPTKGLSARESLPLLRGPVDSTVRLLIGRGEESREVAVIREALTPDTLTWKPVSAE